MLTLMGSVSRLTLVHGAKGARKHPLVPVSEIAVQELGTVDLDEGAHLSALRSGRPSDVDKREMASEVGGKETVWDWL